MQWPDAVNATFELAGGFFIAFSCFRLYKDKIVKGVSWITMSFFMTWGYWNLYFYPALDQWLSFVGGIGIVIVNTLYVAMIWHYLQKGKDR